MSTSCLRPHCGRERRQRRLEVDARVAAVDDRLDVRRRQRQPVLERLVDDEAPDLLERDFAGELLDVDAPVAERGAFLVRLGDLRLEGDNALEPKVRGGAHLPILAKAAWAPRCLESPHHRRPHLRRHDPAPRAPPRGAAHARRSVPLRGEGRTETHRDHRLRVAAPPGSRRRRGADLAVRARPRRAAGFREEVLADRARAHGARRQAHRSRQGDRAAHVSASAGHRPARERRRADARARVLRQPAPGQERDGAGGHSPRAARRRGGDGCRARPLPASRGFERLVERRRRAADVGTREARDPGCVHAARLHGRGVHRLARRAVRDRPRHGLGRDPGGRADRDRPLAQGRGDRVLRRHDAHVLHRRDPGRAARVPPPREGVARPFARGSARRREGA